MNVLGSVSLMVLVWGGMLSVLSAAETPLLTAKWVPASPADTNAPVAK